MNAWMPADLPFEPGAFSGKGRLFPLPQVVAFPHVVTALHVFEPRYLSLTADALSTDGLITMAVLKPGWESDYAGRPPLHAFACLGKVISHHTDAPGNYNLLLLGLRRVQLLEEITPPEAFRRRRLQLVDESEPPACKEQTRLRSGLVNALLERVAAPAVAEELGDALAQCPGLGALADLAAHALPLPGALKLRLLGEADAGRRARLILDAVGALQHGPAAFPPPYSLN